ncbi:MAG TPA: hypothetical protein VHW90_05215 [Stellaceae bacterium]|jgi:hypothetical protein|nr:hypothetical protein [Stellaceae bacterium]
MSDNSTFLDRCIAGEAALDAIDDFVDEWHATPCGRELHDYLGMTAEEYSLWLRMPDTLTYIVKARQDNRPLRGVIQTLHDGMGETSDKRRLGQWLQTKTQLA